MTTSPLDIDLTRTPSIGLALGGGGALGAAHVGVLQVLHERGIVPSIVTGTSAGSLMGAAYAAGWDPYALEALVIRAEWGHFGTVTLKPGIGILDTEGLRRTIEAIGRADTLIEELPVTFAAIATDMVSHRAVALTSGLLVDALRASISVPGLFRPVRIDGRLLVDGGLMENLPLGAAFDLGAQHVIGVRLAPEWDAPGFETALAVHELEIRSDVTLISPRLGSRSQWVAADVPGLIALGREAAERSLSPYPVVKPRPATLPDVEVPEPARLPEPLRELMDRRSSEGQP